MKLYLVRHTRVDVPPGICYGQTDVPLADSFETELASIRTRLSGIQFDHVFCSPLSRCVNLGMVLDYPLLFDDRLKELNFGEWENRTWDEISEMEAGKKWFTDYLNETCPGGESYHDMLHRVKNFIADLPQSSGNILVITHAGIIRAFQVLLESQQANGTRNGQILPESKSLASVHSVNKVFDEPIAYGQITIIEKRP